MKKFLLILLVGIISLPLILTGCGTPKTALELEKQSAAGIWIETVEGSGNIEMSEDGSIRIFDSLQTNELKGIWDIPEIGAINITIDGSPVANLEYKFEDDTMAIWQAGKENQPLVYKKASQKDVNEMQKKAKDYADKIKETNEENNVQKNEVPETKEELSMKQEEAKKDKVIVIFETTAGNLELAVYPKVAPLTVKTFLDLVEGGFYNGIIFHRVIPQFMIQTGVEKADGSANNSVELFKDEINPEMLGLGTSIIQEKERKGYQYDYTLPSLPMIYGSLAMANSGPNTNSSQIFIVTKFDGCKWLDGLHTVFGECISGMDVALNIQNAQTDSMDKPIENITITKAYIKE